MISFAFHNISVSNSVDLVKHIVTECSARAVPDFLQSSEVPETQRALSEFQNHSIYLVLISSSSINWEFYSSKMTIIFLSYRLFSKFILLAKAKK